MPAMAGESTGGLPDDMDKPDAATLARVREGLQESWGADTERIEAHWRRTGTFWAYSAFAVFMFFIGVLGLIAQHNVGGGIALVFCWAIGAWVAGGRSWLGSALHSGERYVLADTDALTIGAETWPWTKVQKVQDRHVKCSAMSLTALGFVLTDGGDHWGNLNYLDVEGMHLERVANRRIEHAGLLARLGT